jgi:hypothetical protein
METMMCGYRITRRQSLLFLVSSILLVIFLVTFVWLSSDGTDWNTQQLDARPRCHSGDCNPADGVAANAAGRRLHVARNSRGLEREKAALQRYELQQAGESVRHQTKPHLDRLSTNQPNPSLALHYACS